MSEFELDLHKSCLKKLFIEVFNYTPKFRIAAELMEMSILIKTRLISENNEINRVIYYEIVFAHQGNNWNHVFLKNYAQMHAEIILFNIIKENLKNKRSSQMISKLKDN